MQARQTPELIQLTGLSEHHKVLHVPMCTHMHVHTHAHTLLRKPSSTKENSPELQNTAFKEAHGEMWSQAITRLDLS